MTEEVETGENQVSDKGYLVPDNNGKVKTDPAGLVPSVLHYDDTDSSTPRRTYLNGRIARQKRGMVGREYVIWDTALIGFGLRVRAKGDPVWMVRARHRDKQRRITLGKCRDLSANDARTQARRLLAKLATDGLPERTVVKATPTLRTFVMRHWDEVARYWKPSTASTNARKWRLDLDPIFGKMHLSDIHRTDIVRWRDGCAGDREAKYNRAIPILAAFLKYAEQMGLRRKGSNPCRGMPRYKRPAMERYLSPLEYRHIAEALNAAESTQPTRVAIIRLLIYTGARVSEIRDLQWQWVQSPRLLLPDSKTGAKTIWLNGFARDVLDAVPRRKGVPFVFANRRGTAPIEINVWWSRFRLGCSLPDVRMHDLRHSFASTAIMDNVPLSVIGKLLGHALPETTAKYAHLSDAIISDAAQRVSGSLARMIGIGR